MTAEYESITLDDEPEHAQAARILTWVAGEKAKLKVKLDGLVAMEKDARSVIEQALGGKDGPAAEAVFGGRPIARWSRFTTHRLDQKGLKKAYPEQFDAFYNEITERKFTIVPPKEEQQ